MKAVDDLRARLDEYEKARRWDARIGEPENTGNTAGDALAAAVRAVLLPLKRGFEHVDFVEIDGVG